MTKFSDLKKMRDERDRQVGVNAPQEAPPPTQASPQVKEESHTRRPGKRRDATYTKATVYLDRRAYLEAKSRMTLEGRKGEVSDLLSALLIGYLTGEFQVRLPDIPSENDPPMR